MTRSPRARAQTGWERRWMRLYGRARRGLRRAHLAGLFDVHWCEVVRSGENPPPGFGGDDGSLWVGELGPEQRSWLAALSPERDAEFSARWHEGRRCFVAMVEDLGERRCVSYCWIAMGPTRLAGRQGRCWAIPEGMAWRFDAWSHPLALGIYPFLAHRTMQRLRQEGVGQVMGQIEFDNRISRQVHHRLGARRLGWILDLCFAGASIRCERDAWSLHLHGRKAPVRLADYLPAEPAAMPRRHAQVAH